MSMQSPVGRHYFTEARIFFESFVLYGMLWAVLQGCRR